MAVQEKTMERWWMTECVPILLVLLELYHELHFRIPDATLLTLLATEELISETAPLSQMCHEKQYI